MIEVTKFIGKVQRAFGSNMNMIPMIIGLKKLHQMGFGQGVNTILNGMLPYMKIRRGIGNKLHIQIMEVEQRIPMGCGKE